jgi:hypothetical protein
VRFREIRMLMEAEARIDHAEDIIYKEGSKGVLRVLDSLRNLEKSGHKDVTIKWDGSPAVIFGRNENGDFVFTDKSGFSASGYDGKTTSAEDVRQMFLSRSGGAKRNDPKQIAFSNAMADLYNQFELIVPQDHRGYFKGDLLYSQTPKQTKNNYVFKPNIVTYAVDTESDLGKRIAASNAGIVIHRQVDFDGEEKPLGDIDMFTGDNVLVVPPITVEKPATKLSPAVEKLETVVKQNAGKIDELLDRATLSSMKMTDFPKILYSYTNNKVDTGLTNIGADFFDWLENKNGISQVKKQRIGEYVSQHKEAWKSLWKTYSAILQIKDKVISQFDAQGSTVKQSIDGFGDGGEGYVLAHPQGDIKLVPRATFTAANRAVKR